MKPAIRPWSIRLTALAVTLLAAACAGPAPSPMSAAEVPGSPRLPDTVTPPAAELSVDGAPAVAGELGSYRYLGRGSDSPWLPAAMLQPVQVNAAGDPLVVRLANGEPIAGGRARVARAADTQGTQTEALGLSLEQQSVVIFGPGSGSWVLAVELDYADGAGSGAYFWRLEVR
jgi:hypothetical protein